MSKIFFFVIRLYQNSKYGIWQIMLHDNVIALCNIETPYEAPIHLYRRVKTNCLKCQTDYLKDKNEVFMTKYYCENQIKNLFSFWWFFFIQNFNLSL